MTDSIKTKIANLLAKAESTDNVYEQQAFMAKVNELLERHQMDMYDIRKHAGADKDPMTRMTGDLPSSHEWPTQVAFKLARYYGAKVLRYDSKTRKYTGKFDANGKPKYHRVLKYTYEVLGRESACITFDLMLPFVLSQVRQQARAFARDTGLSVARAERSVGIALADRLQNLIAANDTRRESNERNALVPVTDVDSYVKELYGELRKVRTPTAAIYKGADEFANKVSLNHQATATGHKQIEAQEGA